MTETIAAMDKYNVVLGFLSDPLEQVYDWLARSDTSRFIAAPHWTTQPPPPIEYLRGEYAAGRIQGMGEIGSQYAGLPPNDLSIDSYFQLANELDLPVLIHTAGIGAPLPEFRPSIGDPLLLEGVLRKYPMMRIYVENAGYPFLESMIAILYSYPQVYVDISTISWIITKEAFYDYLNGLVRAGFGKRIMYGSDQMRWPQSIGFGIQQIEEATFLTQEQRDDIFYNNAARFLRLERRDRRFSR